MPVNRYLLFLFLMPSIFFFVLVLALSSGFLRPLVKMLNVEAVFKRLVHTGAPY